VGGAADMRLASLQAGLLERTLRHGTRGRETPPERGVQGPCAGRARCCAAAGSAPTGQRPAVTAAAPAIGRRSAGVRSPAGVAASSTLAHAPAACPGVYAPHRAVVNGRWR